MDNLLIITNRNLKSAPRVVREIQALTGLFKIVGVGIAPAEDPFIGFIDVRTIRQSFSERVVNIGYRLLRMKAPVFKSISLRLKDIEKIVKHTTPNFVITHEPHFLPYLVAIKKEYGFRIIYNAHEYYPLEFTDSWKWNWMWKPFYEGIYKKCLPEIDLLINVCDSIADKCKEVFGKESIVIPNVSVFHQLDAVDNAGNSAIRIIHHGGCLASRKIEMMIEVAQILGEGYQLDLMLTLTSGTYFDQIKELAQNAKNVFIIEPVEFEKIVPFTNNYDIGLFLLPPTNFNYSVALPNKLFEFMQARLCIAIGPSPEMMRYVSGYKMGIISDEFTAKSMAEKIRELTFDDILGYKKNANKAAAQLSAETFNKLFINSINKL